MKKWQKRQKAPKETYIEEENKELLEDELHWFHKVDSVTTIFILRFKPKYLLLFKIPLCKLVPMAMVRPLFSSNLHKLEEDFAYNYWDGATLFYILTTNAADESAEFFVEEIQKWGLLLQQRNDEFLAILDAKLELWRTWSSSYVMATIDKLLRWAVFTESTL